jgi:hypothetical protein
MLLCAYVLKELFDSTQVSVLNCIALDKVHQEKKKLHKEKLISI